MPRYKKKNHLNRAFYLLIFSVVVLALIVYAIVQKKPFNSTSKATHVGDDLERCPENNDDYDLIKKQPCCRSCVIDRYNGEHITYAAQCNNYRSYEYYDKESGEYCDRTHDEKGNNLYLCGKFYCPDGPRRFCLDGKNCQPKEYWYRLQMLVCGQSCPKDCFEHSYLEKCQILCKAPYSCITETNPLSGKKRYFCCKR